MAEKRVFKMGRCHDCGGPMKVARRNQRYCSTCRLARGAGWHDGRPSACHECGAKYIAWNGMKSGRHCAACLLKRSPMGLRESVERECARHVQSPEICRSGTAGARAWLFSKDVNLCFPCLLDPKLYETNRRSILKVAAELRKTP